MTIHRFAGRAALLLAFAAGLSASARAQYFGRNKVQYQAFNFQILRTEHFDVYFYPEEQVAATQAARMAERWYARLSGILVDSLSGRQPLILYASPTQFQQTNAVEGELGEGTGGVTESFKRRVVLPFGVSLAETDHVLGHELVHAFQYDITQRGISQAPGASSLPLWFIEGMAEYFSLGPRDNFTAMWMRDAVLRNDMPPIRRMDDFKYFPYRWGQAFWSWFGSVYGEENIGPTLRNAARTRDPFVALKNITGVDVDTMTVRWHEALRAAFGAPAPAADTGIALLTKQSTGGRLNVGPALSPDGSRVAFISERDLFSVEVFLADAETGRVIRRLTQTARNPHLESIQFIYSAGAFSPDGQRFALAATVRGRPSLQIVNVDNGRNEREVPLRQLDEILNPSWSPDGQKLVFTAQIGGLTDLYIYDLAANELRRLTEDAFADLQPAWSPDGNSIAFVTDRFGTSVENLSYSPLRLATINPSSGQISELPSLGSGMQINPQWAQGGRVLYFLSDAAGLTDVYRLEVASGALSRVTRLPAGVSGIAALSPALAVAANTERMMVSVHAGENNNVLRFDGPAALAGEAVAARTADTSLTLAAPNGNPRSAVVAYLADASTGRPSEQEFSVGRYRSKLSLDYIAPPTLSAGSDQFGAFLGGGSALYFGSMLGDQQLAAMLQVNGGLKDIAAGVQYVNRRHRFDWGVSASQIPYLTGGYSRTFENVNGQPAVVDREMRFRQTSREVTGLMQYAFNRVQRFEMSGGVRNIAFSIEERAFAYDQNTGIFIGESRQDLPAPAGLTFGEASAALVYDNSLFGGTGPVTGRRWRVEATPTFGSLNFIGALADFRQYLMPVRPITLAARVMHYARYGSGSDDQRLQPLFLGYQGILRGYDFGSVSNAECDSTATSSCQVFDNLLGSRILVGNLEARLPLLGPLGILARRVPIPTDLFVFADAGVAWGRGQKPEPFASGAGARPLVTSYGAGLRVNLFGALIGELDIVKPMDRPNKGWYLQFGLIQGGF